MRSKSWPLPLFIIFFVLTSCTNNHSTSSIASGGTGTYPTVQSAPTYTVEPLLEGNGQVTSFATYSTNLFWSDEYYGDGIWKYSITDDAAPVLLAPRFHTPEIIVVHGNYFYWVDTSADGFGKKLLYKTALDGSQTTLLRNSKIDSDTTNQILVDDTAVYWVNVSISIYSPRKVQIEKVPLDGSEPQTVYTASDGVRALSMDNDYIYWLEQAASGCTLFRIAKTGGTVDTLYQGLSDSFCGSIEPSINMVVNNNFVYLGLAGQIIKIPSGGGSLSIIAQSAEVCPLGITVYDSNLYWLNYSRSALPGYGGGVGILSAPTDTTGSFSVVVANLAASKGLHASLDGLSWAEADQNYVYMLKRLSWGAGSSDTLATGIYFVSSDIVGSQLYFTEIAYGWRYSQIGRISLTTGIRETLLGGLNNVSVSLLPTENYLIFGDGYALKKVPVDGGRVESLLVDNNVTFNHLYEKDGFIFFSSGGIYKIPLNGGSVTLLATDVGSSDIISIQDGYVYYACYCAWPPLAELHRAAIDGGTPEVVYKVPEGKELLAFDGITEAYLKEWIWNDKYKLLKHDLATGQETQLYSGRIRFLGMNADAVFIDDWNGWIHRIPKDGGTSYNILTVSYPLTLDPYWINAGAEDFYFSVSSLDETQGYFSEIALLKRLN